MSTRMVGNPRCASCGCDSYHHRRNVYRFSGIAKAGVQDRGGIIGRRLGKCWFAGCKAGVVDGITGCAGWKNSKGVAA